MKATHCRCCGEVAPAIALPLMLGLCEACLKHMHEAKWTNAHIQRYYR